MRLMKPLSSDELQAHIKNLYLNLKPKIEFSKLSVYFEMNSFNEEGVYVYSDEKGYHYTYSEKGRETTHKITDDLFEISFWTLYPTISSEAFAFASRNAIKGHPFGKLHFRSNWSTYNCWLKF